jgi:hypothetical protein
MDFVVFGSWVVSSWRYVQILFLPLAGRLRMRAQYGAVALGCVAASSVPVNRIGDLVGSLLPALEARQPGAS